MVIFPSTCKYSNVLVVIIVVLSLCMQCFREQLGIQLTLYMGRMKGRRPQQVWSLLLWHLRIQVTD